MLNAFTPLRLVSDTGMSVECSYPPVFGDPCTESVSGGFSQHRLLLFYRTVVGTV